MIDDSVGDSTDDSYVYPAHGELYLHFDDEEITWAKAASEHSLREFDQEFERRGWLWLNDKEQNRWDEFLGDRQ